MKEVTLFLIRHGQSQAQLQKDVWHSLCPQAELTPLGEEQADRVGNRLVKEGVEFDLTYTSPLTRAEDTCKRAISQTSFPLNRVIRDFLLLERYYGEWEGMRRENPKKMPRSYQFCMPGGESLEMLEKKSVAAVARIVEQLQRVEKPNPTALVFGHSQSFRTIFRVLMGLSEEQAFLLYVANASISKVRFKNNRWVVDVFNDTKHLEDLEGK